MSISYPVSIPAAPVPRSLVLRARSVVGVSISPYSFAQQVYAHPGEMWEMDVDLPPMQRSRAEDWISFILKLNGREGTFLMGDPVNTTARGTWSGGAPVVSGAQAAGIKTLPIRGVDGLNWKAGDWFQLGSGSSTHLHKVVEDGSQSGSPSQANLEIWPRTRAALSDAAVLTLASPKGQWRLASNVREWSLEQAQIFGLKFGCIEAL